MKSESLRARQASAGRVGLAASLVPVLLSACGGGGGGGGSTPTPPPAPSVSVTSEPLARMAMQGAGATLEATIKPNFQPTGSFTVKVADTGTVFNQAVEVAANADGSYTLSLAISTQAAAGRSNGNLKLNLCADTACATMQQVSSVSLPYDVNLVTSTMTWPGNNLSTLAPFAGVADWSMYQGNAAHTGQLPVELNPNKFSPRWRISAYPGFSPSWRLSGNFAVSAEDKLYLASGLKLTVLKESDASQAWVYDFSSLPYPSANPPAIANGVVYIAAGQQSSTYLFALGANDGSVKFKSAMSAQWEHYLAPTIGPNGIYTNAGTYGGAYGFDTEGKRLFFTNVGQFAEWTPAVDANNIYTYTGGLLRVIDAKTGAITKSIPDPSFTNYVYDIGGSPVLGNDMVFAANYANAGLNGGTMGNTLSGFKISTGTLAWQIKGNFPSTPAYNAGTLYVANENPMRLEARSETDGSLQWSWVPQLAGDTKFESEVVLTKNLVFVSTSQGTYAIDLKSHKAVWSYPQTGRLSLSRNGLLYIHGDTHLTAINLK